MQAADRVFSHLSVSHEWVNDDYHSLCAKHKDKDKTSIEDDNSVSSRGIVRVRKETEGITQKGGCTFASLSFPVAVTKHLISDT